MKRESDRRMKKDGEKKEEGWVGREKKKDGKK